MAAVSDPPKLAFNLEELYERLNKALEHEKPTKQSFSQSMQKLRGILHGIDVTENEEELIDAEGAVENTNNEVPTTSEPEVSESNTDPVIIDEKSHIEFVDPYFYFYVRWSPIYYKIRRNISTT